jgi:hypothetical protein
MKKLIKLITMLAIVCTITSYTFACTSEGRIVNNSNSVIAYNITPVSSVKEFSIHHNTLMNTPILPGKSVSKIRWTNNTHYSFETYTANIDIYSITQERKTLIDTYMLMLSEENHAKQEESTVGIADISTGKFNEITQTYEAPSNLKAILCQYNGITFVEVDT